MKRLFDLCFSFMVLTCLLPVFLLLILLIRREVFYVQPRLGKKGEIFNCYKIRTMYRDADKRLEQLLSENSSLKHEWNKNQKLRQDPRIFALGRFLRMTSLDELPQFFNVLKGDLSVVGPRPYMVSQLKEMGPYANKILSIRPGITGLWQTSGRSKTTFQQRVALDAEYVDKSSFCYDLKLILKTIPAILPSSDAY